MTQVMTTHYDDVFKRLFAYISLAAAFLLAVSCQVIDDAGEPAIDGMPGDNSQQVDIGNGSVPTDDATFGAYLHANSSKVWDANQFTIEGMRMFLSCRLDDQITLHSDGTYDYDGGTELCGADDDVRERSGTWAFDVDNLTVTIDPTTENETTVRVVTLQEELAVLEGVYESDLFGRFEIAGRYTSN